LPLFRREEDEDDDDDEEDDVEVERVFLACGAGGFI